MNDTTKAPARKRDLRRAAARKAAAPTRPTAAPVRDTAAQDESDRLANAERLRAHLSRPTAARDHAEFAARERVARAGMSAAELRTADEDLESDLTGRQY